MNVEKKNIWKKIWQIGSAIGIVIALLTTAIATLGATKFPTKTEYEAHVQKAEEKYVQYKALEQILSPMQAQISDIHKALIER